MDVFTAAVNFVLAEEGACKNDPNDPGGETAWGISKRAYPGLDIAKLTKDQARAIYYHDYWLRPGLYQLPSSLAVAVFDAAVNEGQKTAVVLLQLCLPVPMKIDGDLGPATLAAVTKQPLAELLPAYLAQRAIRYARNPHFVLYGHGWLRRLFQVHKACLEVVL